MRICSPAVKLFLVALATATISLMCPAKSAAQDLELSGGWAHSTGETEFRNAAFPTEFENEGKKATTYYFSNELLPGNDFQLVDTRNPPQWR